MDEALEQLRRAAEQLDDVDLMMQSIFNLHNRSPRGWHEAILGVLRAEWRRRFAGREQEAADALKMVGELPVRKALGLPER